MPLKIRVARLVRHARLFRRARTVHLARTVHPARMLRRLVDRLLGPVADAGRPFRPFEIALMCARGRPPCWLAGSAPRCGPTVPVPVRVPAVTHRIATRPRRH